MKLRLWDRSIGKAGRSKFSIAFRLTKTRVSFRLSPTPSNLSPMSITRAITLWELISIPAVSPTAFASATPNSRMESPTQLLGPAFSIPAPGIELAIGGDPNCLTAGPDDFCSGPNFLAPQATVQSNKQIKYDGSKAYGRTSDSVSAAGYNRIVGGGFAEFLGLAPAVGSPSNATLSTPLPEGGNPLNYPVTNVTLGNGQGFSSEKSTFGFPAEDWVPTIGFPSYFGDSLKLKSELHSDGGLALCA